MSDTRSLRHLLVSVRSHAEPIQPLINTGRRNADRIFGADEIIPELAGADVAEHRSLVQPSPGGDLRGFEELLD